MATHEFDLIDGLKIGEVVHTRAVLCEPTAGDVLDAAAAAERPVATPAGWQLLSSPSAVGAEILRRQVVKIGDHPGPLALVELRKLSARDLNILQAEAEGLEKLAAEAAAKELAGRGRD